MAERIAKIVSNMKSLAWDSSSETPSEFEVSELGASVLDLCQESLEKNGVGISVHQSESMWICARKIQLSQVLVNLTNNGWHAVESLPEKWVKISFEKMGQDLRIRVRDSGKGIPAHIREKIMEPFFTTKEPGKGTGLGLSISKELVNKNGGRLWIDANDPNTCFVVDLPKVVILKERNVA
jgi:C4-dicarboxylate-specific signal transduction histidine kinase